MFLRPLPPALGLPGWALKVNFVARTTRSRAPDSARSCPSISSLRPPVYRSAVSTKLPPASR